MKRTNNKTSSEKYLALILCHELETANIELDKNGWTDVATLCINAKYLYRKLLRNNLQKNFNEIF